MQIKEKSTLYKFYVVTQRTIYYFFVCNINSKTGLVPVKNIYVYLFRWLTHPDSRAFRRFPAGNTSRAAVLTGTPSELLLDNWQGYNYKVIFKIETIAIIINKILFYFKQFIAHYVFVYVHVKYDPRNTYSISSRLFIYNVTLFSTWTW